LAIPYSRQDIDQADIAAVVDVLQSDFLTQGPIVPAFEEAVSNYCGVQYALAVSNATSALHIACLALGVGQGDIVWTSPITFVASANCALFCGAEVDFVDIDPLTYNLSLLSLEEKLVAAKRIGKLPKVLIPVHFSGQSCDMFGIYELSKKYGFKIIEDASHAIGGSYKNERIGNCRYSDITVFSFHPVKIITTGEGGMVVTNNRALAKRMSRLRAHGITSSAVEMLPFSLKEIWNYQQIDLGFNYRMTDIQAALGLSQMKRLDNFLYRRYAIAKYYDELLSGLPLITPSQDSNCISSFHLYVICLKLDEINKSQRQVYDGLREAGILINIHYIPVYLQPYYTKMGFTRGWCPNAERYFSTTISLPIYPALAQESQIEIVKELRILLND
jgi:UDP-4-amino-4,6-dideoxy-N-acetyl-beta-L-altrosamine transaminase